MKLSQFVVRSVKLEPLTQSEVSQKEQNKYHILTRIYGICKYGTDEPDRERNCEYSRAR